MITGCGKSSTLASPIADPQPSLAVMGMSNVVFDAPNTGGLEVTIQQATLWNDRIARQVNPLAHSFRLLHLRELAVPPFSKVGGNRG